MRGGKGVSSLEFGLFKNKVQIVATPLSFGPQGGCLAAQSKDFFARLLLDFLRRAKPASKSQSSVRGGEAAFSLEFGLFENKVSFVAIHCLVRLGEGGLTAKTRFALMDYRHLFVVGESPQQKAKLQEGRQSRFLHSYIDKLGVF